MGSHRGRYRVMHTEVEAKFIAIDPEQMRHRLTTAGADLVSKERLMRRTNFDAPKGTPHAQASWIRVRDESNKITASYKRQVNTTATGTLEINLEVNDYDTAVGFLEACGLTGRSYQETRRESWLLGEVEVELDWWPWLPPTLELEGPDESALKAAARKLGLDWATHRGGDITPIYAEHYTATPQEIVHARITFTEPCPWPRRT